MSILKKLASQTAVYGLSTMLGRFLNYALVPLYLSKFTPAEYGVVSVMFTYASFLAIVFALGLETAFFHFSKQTQQPAKVLSTATYTLLLTGFAAILIVRWLGPEIMTWIGYPNHPVLFEYLVYILVADSISALGFAWLRQQEKPWTFAWIRITNIGVNIASNLLLLVVAPAFGYYVLNHQPSFLGISMDVKAFDSKFWQSLATWGNNQSKPENMIANIFISNLLASLITVPLLSKTFTNLKEGFDVDLIKRMLKYSLPLIVVGLAGMINETLDRLMLKNLLPSSIADAETGMYNAFYKLSLVLTLFIQAFRFAAEPFFFSKSGDGDAKQTYAYVMRIFVYATGGIYLLTMLCMPWIAPLLMQNPVYYTNARGLSIIPVLLGANVCLGLYYNLSIWYKLSGQTKMGGAIAAIGAVVTLLGNYLFIPTYGFVASAYTTLFAYVTLVILGYLFGQKHYPIPYPLLPIFATLSVAIIPIVGLPMVLPSLSYNYYFLLPLFYIATVLLIEKYLNKNHAKS
jgi:O-antigen/teichoic acid export membrane protein